MNARDQLLGTLVKLHGWHPNEVNTLIDDFAHELAEQQRASGKDTYCSGIDCCQEHGGVADLIDPEVQRTNTSKETP